MEGGGCYWQSCHWWPGASQHHQVSPCLCVFCLSVFLCCHSCTVCISVAMCRKCLMCLTLSSRPETNDFLLMIQICTLIIQPFVLSPPCDLFLCLSRFVSDYTWEGQFNVSGTAKSRVVLSVSPTGEYTSTYGLNNAHYTRLVPSSYQPISVQPGCYK